MRSQCQMPNVPCVQGLQADRRAAHAAAAPGHVRRRPAKRGRHGGRYGAAAATPPGHFGFRRQPAAATGRRPGARAAADRTGRWRLDHELGERMWRLISSIHLRPLVLQSCQERNVAGGFAPGPCCSSHEAAFIADEKCVLAGVPGIATSDAGAFSANRCCTMVAGPFYASHIAYPTAYLSWRRSKLGDLLS